MAFVTSLNEAANVLLAGYPTGAAIGENDIAAIDAMVVACIREVFVWTSPASGFIG